jgi:phosphate transport system substrate-binding protein
MERSKGGHTFERAARAALVAAGLSALACGGGREAEEGGAAADGGLTGTVSGDGSSTVFPIMEAVAEEFQRENPGVRVTIGISGTGGGFKKFCAGETDLSNASRPIKPTEVKACRAAGVEYVEFPIAFDGLSVMVNPANDFAACIEIAELRRLWEPEAQGAVTRWSQVRPGWPDEEVHLYGAGVDSGTYDYFTEAVVGEEGSSRGDFTSSEDDNVLVQGVAGDELALAFIPLAYVSQNAARLKIVPVDDAKADNGAGPITPSSETVRNGTYQPLSRPLFVYVSRKAADRKDIQQFVEMLFTRTDLVREVGYIELTPQIYDLARAHFAERRTGTAFEKGHQVGMTLEALLAREQ